MTNLTYARIHIRRNLIPFLLIAALAILLVIPNGISAQRSGSDGDPVWSADMLVVEYTEISIGAASAGLFSNVGGTGNLQIRSLWSYLPDSDLRLAFTDGVADADDMTLKVGDLELEFPVGSSENSSFKWTGVEVDWEDGDTIAVSIVRTSTLTEPTGNTQDTGGPTITGTPQVDQTLTAHTSSITDEDGLEAVSYEYQWIRNDNGADTDIPGATQLTYTLVYADQGKTIKVKVTFTDDAENEEIRTSEATGTVTAAPNRAATGDPAISGTPQVNQTLTAGTAAISDEDGLDAVSYEYQWTADDTDIGQATEATYTPSTGDVGKTIKVKVSFTDDRNNDESRTSAATTAVLPTVPRQPQSLTVTAGDNIQELDAYWQAPSSNGGADVTGYKVQWKESANSWDTEADVSEATVTGTTYTITGLTGGTAYTVRVIATNSAGDGPASAEAAGTPAGAVSEQTTLTSTTTIIVDQPGAVSLWPKLPRVGTVVSATLTDPDGLEGAGSGAAASLGALTWQWSKSSEGKTWTSFHVAQDGNSYTPTGDDEGMWLKVTAVYTDGHGEGKSAEAITAATIGAREASPELTVTELATGLTHPWDIAFTPDGTMLFTERDDGLRVRLTDGTIRQVTADFSDLNFGGTAGLLALVLDPDFASNRRFYTYQRHTGPEMQVIAWTIDEEYTMATRVADPLVGGIPVNPNRGPSHGGGRLRFGPEGYLWIATGDGFSGTAAQDLTSLGGKVLRVDPQTGAGAPGNPFAPSPVYTYGHRNPQGLALRPGTGQMWSVEHGPDHDDEINLLASGGNYGWDPAPDEGAEGLYDETTTPMTDQVKFPDALRANWSSGYPTLAVGGGVFLEGSQWREWEGQFAVATLKTKSVRVFKFTEAGDLVSQAVVPELDRTYGRLRTAVLGPDGALYITTTNGGGKDKILKVVPANTPATGAPTISGTPQEDETLTADTTSIADPDGITEASYSYQWMRHDGTTDSDIPGATNPTYTPNADDVGKAIKVRVTFTDDADKEETLTSAATELIRARPNSWSATMTVGRRTGFTGYSYWDNPHMGTLSPTEVEWDEKTHHVRYIFIKDDEVRLGLNEEMLSTGFVLSLADQEFGTAEAMVDKGGASYRFRWDDPGLGWSEGDEVTVSLAESDQNTPAFEGPAVNGTPQAENTLKADVSTIQDADGLTNATFKYQWITSDGTTDTDIENETSATYTLADDDIGQLIRVRVAFTDDRDHEETLTSSATAEVVTVATEPGVPVRLDVFPHESGALDVYWDAPASDGGSAITGYKVQWKESTDSWETPADVSEATTNETNHSITGLTNGVEYTVRVTAVNDVGSGQSSADASATPQGEAIWAILTVGTTESFAGYTTFAPPPQSNILGGLSRDTATLDDTSYTVKALGVLDGKVILAVEPRLKTKFVLAIGKEEFASTKATIWESNSLIQFRWSNPGLDWSERERVRIRLTESEANTPATGLPGINGTPQVDQVLTADTSEIDDGDGLTNVSYKYQWIAGESDINGAAGTSYQLTYGDQGKTIQVRVTFTDDADNEETLTSEATVAVAAAPNRDAVGAPTINGTPEVDQTLTADTSAITDQDGLDNVSWQYQWLAGATDISGATGSSYQLTSSEEGKTIQVKVTFTDDRGNSESLTSEATDTVAAKPVPLTATFSNVPTSHDGSGSFTFDLTFSENFPVSYITLRDHAFAEDDNGPVTKAQRKVRGSNQSWTITVEPKGNGAIIITLPQTTDCGDTGAICTDDGRMLSNQTIVTVAGPSQ